MHVEDDLYDLVTHRHAPSSSHAPLSSSSTSSTPYQFSHPNSVAHYAYTNQNSASPALTNVSSTSHSAGHRIHPSVAAQRASAGRVYKRKASTSSLNAQPETHSPYSMGITPSTSSTLSIMHQQPQSPTPQSGQGGSARKLRRSNVWKPTGRSPTTERESGK